MKEIRVSFRDDPVRIQAWIDYLIRQDTDRAHHELVMWRERLVELEREVQV